MKHWTLISAGWIVLAVAMLVLLYQLFVLWQLPVYSASALVGFDSGNPARRASLASIGSRPSFVQSTNVLYPVCDSLDLSEEWGRRYYGGERLTKKETCEFLTRRISILNPKPGDGLVKISCFSEKPDEAVAVANAIANSVTNQLSRSQQATNSDAGMWVQYASAAHRVYNWLHLVRDILFMVIPSVIAGFLLLWWGHRSPSPIPASLPPPQPFRPRY